MATSKVSNSTIPSQVQSDPEGDLKMAETSGVVVHQEQSGSNGNQASLPDSVTSNPTVAENSTAGHERGSDASEVLGGPGVPVSTPEAQGLEFVQRISNLPVSKCAAGVRDAAMGYVVVEKSVAVLKVPVALAAATGSLLCSPFASLCRGPVRGVDWLMCRGLDVAEAVFPCIAVPPNQMYAATKNCAANCVCCRVAACTASTLSSTANKLRDYYCQKS